MRCLIVDDDALARTVLERYVSRYDTLDLVGSCDSALDAADLITRAREAARPVDLAFFDVEMPELNGLELARSLGEDVQVVIVSGKEEYARDAFDLAVADYIVKPVDYARFVRSVERARLLAAARQEGRTASETPQDALPDGHVFVRSEGRFVRVNLQEVAWIEAQKDYVVLHGPEQPVTVHTTMKALAERLPDTFARIHRSTIVRLDQIEDASESAVVVGGTELSVSSTYRQDLMSRLRTL
ncbi:MAG: LytTR family DNA-binding domain-containing protein [Bacteroidota bacterium]